MAKKKIYTIMKNGRPFTYSGFRYPNPWFPQLTRPDEDQHNDDSLITDLPEEKYQEALEVLQSWFIKSEKTSRRHTSYGMKHWLEDAIHHYVSNNQLKDAMLMLGFEPGDPDELNWCFKVKPTPELKGYLERTNRYW